MIRIVEQAGLPEGCEECGNEEASPGMNLCLPCAERLYEAEVAEQLAVQLAARQP